MVQFICCVLKWMCLFAKNALKGRKCLNLVSYQYLSKSIHQVLCIQIGEYFGYSLLTASLTGGNLDDLLVGAPMYTVTGKPEVGRVYVYSNMKVRSMLLLPTLTREKGM